jgi:hypothetical protein
VTYLVYLQKKKKYVQVLSINVFKYKILTCTKLCHLILNPRVDKFFFNFNILMFLFFFNNYICNTNFFNKTYKYCYLIVYDKIL